MTSKESRSKINLFQSSLLIKSCPFWTFWVIIYFLLCLTVPRLSVGNTIDLDESLKSEPNECYVESHSNAITSAVPIKVLFVVQDMELTSTLHIFENGIPEIIKNVPLELNVQFGVYVQSMYNSPVTQCVYVNSHFQCPYQLYQYQNGFLQLVQTEQFFEPDSFIVLFKFHDYLVPIRNGENIASPIFKNAIKTASSQARIYRWEFSVNQYDERMSTDGMRAAGKQWLDFLSDNFFKVDLKYALNRSNIINKSIDVFCNNEHAKFKFNFRKNEVTIPKENLPNSCTQIDIHYCVGDLPTPSPTPIVAPTPSTTPVETPTPSPSPSTTPGRSPSPTCVGLACGVFGV